MLKPYVRPGIDDRPDYDKALSPEDKSAVSRLAADPKRLPPEASSEQPGAQAARLAADGTASVAAAAAVDTAVPDYSSSFLDMRDPMVSADGQRPSAIDVSRLKWGFTLGAALIAAPWAMLNMIAIPNQIALASGVDTRGALASGVASGAGAGVGAAVSTPLELSSSLAVVIGLGAIASMFFPVLIAALSDRTRVAFGRRTPYLVAGGVLSALISLALGSVGNIAGIVVLWIILQCSYAMLVAPLASALSERVPDKFRDVIERWNAIGVLAGQAVGGVVGGLSIAIDAYGPFVCAAVLFALAGVATVLVWPREPSSVEQPHVRFSWGEVWAPLRSLPRDAGHKSFRRLFLSRTFMTAAVGMTAAYLWYIVRFSIYGEGPILTSAPLTLPAGTLIAMLSLASLAGALLASYSAGAVTDKLVEGFGPWWRNSHMAVVCSCALYAIGLLVGLAIVAIGGERSLMIFSFIAGFASGFYDVLVQPLVVDSLPDPRVAGRDLGAYALARPLGLVIGVIGGLCAVAVAGNLEGSAPLSFIGVFPAAIICVALAAFFARK